jgi:WD40 repeat protein
VKKDQYWISGTDVFVKEMARAKEFHYLDISGVTKKFVLDADATVVSNANLTLDKRFLVLRGKKDIQVYALNVQISDGFSQPCNRISSDGEFCGLTGPGVFKLGRRVSERGYQDYEMTDLNHLSLWREVIWNDQRPGTFAVWNNEEIGVGRFIAGKPVVEKIVIPRSGFLVARWMAGRYLTWVDENLRIFDVSKWEYVGDFSSVEAPTMFYPPVDFSPELSAFAAILRESDGDLVLRIVRAQDGAETGQWKFKTKGKEEADVVRFSDDGRDLLMGFHDGTIQVLEASAIRQGKLEPKVIGQHADSVMVGGFLRNQGTVFTLSMDGSVLFHDYKNGNNWLIQGEAVYPTDDAILYSDVVKSSNLVWVGDGGVLQIFDANTRSVDEVSGGRAYFRNNFVSMQKASGSYYLIDTYNLNYLKKLCDWLEPSIRFGIFKSDESPSICL